MKLAALDVFDQVYTARQIDTAAFRALVPPCPALPSAAADARLVDDQFATIAPKFAQLTKDVVFDNLWRRPDLSVRDRSLVTLAALASMGDDGPKRRKP